jgi:N-dimethylarginine dimethylaminohydrolase
MDRHADPSETGALAQVVLKHARDAFRDRARVAAEWRALNFLAPPDYDRAIGEYDAFAELIARTGADLRFLPPDDRVGLDSIYVRDAAAMVHSGVVLCRMGKALRAAEPAAQQLALADWGIPIVGRIEPPGLLEGGDVVWLDACTVAVGRGYRTNEAGIAQFAALAGPDVTCITVPLPHWRGPSDVFHLMSIVSPVDRDLAVVYGPLMPVPFREMLLERGYRLVEVPDEEFTSMGANVLALAPGRCLMVAGNPRTRRLLEKAGADVTEYEGSEISLKGGGGPTCLTRPTARQADGTSVRR